MRSLKDTPINVKLSLLVLVAGGGALLLSSVAFVASSAHSVRASKVQQLSVLAKVLGSNSTAALTFDDSRTAGELLASLSLKPTLRFAVLYDAKGKVFAVYRSPSSPEFVPPTPFATEGYEFTADGCLDVTQRIVNDSELVGTIYLRDTMEDVQRQLLESVSIVTAIMLVSLGVALLLSRRLQRVVSAPILQLAETAQRVSATRDYSIRVRKESSDELGTLYDEFNAMLDEIQRGGRELQEAHSQLEVRVEERTRQLSAANRELSREIADRKRAEGALEQVHQQLLDVARRAGMAEIATGVLHNVGNVLNSVNVSATLVVDRLRNSKLSELDRALHLMQEHTQDMGAYLAEDEKGRQIPGFLQLVATHLRRERTVVLQELQSLTKNVDHIKAIVAMQQSYAGVAGVVEPVSVAGLLDDALKLNAAALEKRHIELVRDYADLPEVQIEKQRLLQILVNLINNAKDALSDGDRQQRRITARIGLQTRGGDDRLVIEIADNGAGISPENLTRVFSHGFTTKKHGHGFGLHSSAIAARELGGSLAARSEGPGRGATFTIELPFNPVEVPV